MFTAIMAAISLGLNMAQGGASVRAARKSARANMAALENEANWNLNVMNKQKQDIYAKNILEAYGSGINPESGSTRAIIEGNQKMIQEEIDFRKTQYAIELGNLTAQSKQKYLGIF